MLCYIIDIILLKLILNNRISINIAPYNWFCIKINKSLCIILNNYKRNILFYIFLLYNLNNILSNLFCDCNWERNGSITIYIILFYRKPYLCS